MQEESDLDAALAAMRVGVDAEIQAARREAERRGGEAVLSPLGAEGVRWLVRGWDGAPVVGARMRIAGAAGTAGAVVVASRGDGVVVRTASGARVSPGPAFVRADAPAWLFRLRDAVAGLGSAPSGGTVRRRAAQALGADARTARAAWRAAGLNPRQLEAVETALGSEASWISGPPGTGKTAVLTEIVLGLIGRGERVLVLANSNAAVDEVARRVAERLPSERVEAGEVLRVGGPAGESARVLRAEDLAARALPSLRARRAELERTVLEAEQGGGPDPAQRRRSRDVRAAACAELSAVRARMVATAAAAAARADAVFATAHRALGADLADMEFDAVLIDEAGMMPLPMVVAAVGRAGRRIVVAGDHRQLPVVSLADGRTARTWFARDAFAASGAAAALEGGGRAGVTELTVQYRMHPEISGLVSRCFYGGRLTSGVGRCAVRSGPRKNAIRLVDTGALKARCVSAAGGSRINVASALAAVEAVAEGAGSGSVGVATPYAAQRDLINAALAARGLPPCAATVHRFQGGERDLMIVDLPDAPPCGAGPFLKRGEGVPAIDARLLNVALSRARDRLVLIADVDYLSGVREAGAALRAVLDAPETAGARGPAVLQEAPATSLLDGARRGARLASAEASHEGLAAWLPAIRKAAARGVDVLATLGPGAAWCADALAAAGASWRVGAEPAEGALLVDDIRVARLRGAPLALPGGGSAAAFPASAEVARIAGFLAGAAPVRPTGV